MVKKNVIQMRDGKEEKMSYRMAMYRDVVHHNTPQEHSSVRRRLNRRKKCTIHAHPVQTSRLSSPETASTVCETALELSIEPTPVDLR